MKLLHCQRNGFDLVEQTRRAELAKAAVCGALRVPVAALNGTKGAPAVAQARQVGYLLCRTALGLSLPATSRAFRRTQATVWLGLKSLARRMQADEALRGLVEMLQTQLRITVADTMGAE